MTFPAEMLPKELGESCSLCHRAAMFYREYGVNFSSDIPDPDAAACYAADASALLASFVEMTLEATSSSPGFRKNRAGGWQRERWAIAFGASAALIAGLTGYDGLTTGRNGAHLRARLAGAVPGADALLDHSGREEFTSLCAVAARLSEESLDRHRLRHGAPDVLAVAMMLGVALTQSAPDATAKLLGAANFAAVLQPLRDASQAVSAGPSRPTPPAAVPSRSYESWVEQCMQWTRMRRIPDRLVSDLIPPAELADSRVMSLDEARSKLEAEWPGRAAWVDSHGIGTDVVAEFWSMPAWVRGFCNDLMRRNLQLEIRARQEQGESRDEATMWALFFIPFFALEFPDNHHDDGALPVELIPRVIEHFSKLDSPDIESRVMGAGRRTASGYLRTLSQQGLL